MGVGRVVLSTWTVDVLGGGVSYWIRRSSPTSVTTAGVKDTRRVLILRNGGGDD